ncbi:MAG: DUF192 domain-containing protein [Candidatus Thiodiazotropha sp. (ex Epidulcina cf. delphinae)]|nr:DUF192 domain-containing protein [Candidatus Thiodiazotropha sp. (ex Epidulcina cf. delphinae)]
MTQDTTDNPMKIMALRRRVADRPARDEATGLQVRLADGYLSRLSGLLGKKRLNDSEGLLLKRCSAVHTIGMRYPLDLVFMDRQGKVLKCREGVKPCRAVAGGGAYYTLELNQGVIRKQGIAVNDRFVWQGLETG